MAMSTAVGEPLKKGKKMSAGRRAASRLSSGRWGSRLQVFPRSGCKPARSAQRRTTSRTAWCRRVRARRVRSPPAAQTPEKCQEQNRTVGTKCPKKPLQPPVSSGVWPGRPLAPSGKPMRDRCKDACAKDAARSAKAPCLLQKLWQAVGLRPQSPSRQLKRSASAQAQHRQ